MAVASNLSTDDQAERTVVCAAERLVQRNALLGEGYEARVLVVGHDALRVPRRHGPGVVEALRDSIERLRIYASALEPELVGIGSDGQLLPEGHSTSAVLWAVRLRRGETLFAPGWQAEHDSAVRVAAVGAALSRCRTGAAREIVPTAAFDRILDIAISQIAQHRRRVDTAEASLRSLRRRRAALARAAGAAAQAPPAKGHGDLNLANVIVCDGLQFIDPGYAVLGALFDRSLAPCDTEAWDLGMMSASLALAGAAERQNDLVEGYATYAAAPATAKLAVWQTLCLACLLGVSLKRWSDFDGGAPAQREAFRNSVDRISDLLGQEKV